VAAPSLLATHLADAQATVKPRIERGPVCPSGLEPPANTPKNSTNPAPGGAESGALGAQIAPEPSADPTLDRLVEAIGNLTPDDRAKLLAALGAKPTDGSER
jgi:hypothetical protein